MKSTLVMGQTETWSADDLQSWMEDNSIDPEVGSISIHYISNTRS